MKTTNMKITKVFQWDAAHKLTLPYKSKCQDVHGHTYFVEVTIEGPINENGMVMDFSDFKKIEKIGFDHKYLNDIIDINPTAENLVIYLKDKIDESNILPKDVDVKKIRIWETPNSCAEKEWR